MLKKIIIISIPILLISISFFMINEDLFAKKRRGGCLANSKGDDCCAKQGNYYVGKRWRNLKTRKSALGRYINFKYCFVADKDEIELLCGTEPYRKNGFYDRGYMPDQPTYGSKANLPAGFWVFVCPRWYIYEKESREFREYDPNKP